MMTMMLDDAWQWQCWMTILALLGFLLLLCHFCVPPTMLDDNDAWWQWCLSLLNNKNVGCNPCSTCHTPPVVLLLQDNDDAWCGWCFSWLTCDNDDAWRQWCLMSTRLEYDKFGDNNDVWPLSAHYPSTSHGQHPSLHYPQPAAPLCDQFLSYLPEPPLLCNPPSIISFWAITLPPIFSSLGCSLLFWASFPCTPPSQHLPQYPK